MQCWPPSSASKSQRKHCMFAIACLLTSTYRIQCMCMFGVRAANRMKLQKMYYCFFKTCKIRCYHKLDFCRKFEM
jgi:hypothetical protein